jgi:hypothetical protein
VRLVILGAGLAGTIASSAFRGYNPTVYEAKPDVGALDNHKAVMRIRDPEVGNLLGCNLKPIKATKEVWFKGQLHQQASIQMNNLYSQKAYGCIGRRSLNSLGTVDRYLIEGTVKPVHCEYGKVVTHIDAGKIHFSTGSHRTKSMYDICISTIPMPTLLMTLYGEYSDVFKTEEIYVCEYKLYDIKSTVHQTIYFPEEQYPMYRATLQNDKLIVEAIEGFGEQHEGIIAEAFGLKRTDFSHESDTTQKAGKLIPIDEDVRLSTIYKLTNDHNIYSFGRYAIWKAIRTDHLLKDIDLIKRMMNAKTKYDKGRLQI